MITRRPFQLSMVGNKEESFFARALNEARKRKNLPETILESSHDSESFEKLAMEQMKKGPINEISKPEEVVQSRGYQRIEEWDAENKQNMTWEQRVQFDGQRHGDRVKQNTILQKFLR
eukprot:CAMPEP_0195527808 /NCGR_PEP_ID=MMETSP0794_2-20130614/29736_1 /TAXON_ID=515487 /ORGANISM="Stephanopyxis turris, Strain CCMP 815" /LENGTH=117 /DNA_ID=CAMNT_0040658809 /DNA_START=291 /DNA_END=644 /DNA_ORIENTATION=+